MILNGNHLVEGWLFFFESYQMMMPSHSAQAV